MRASSPAFVEGKTLKLPNGVSNPGLILGRETMQNVDTEAWGSSSSRWSPDDFFCARVSNVHASARHGSKRAHIDTNVRPSPLTERTMPKYLCLQRTVPAPESEPNGDNSDNSDNTDGMEAWYAAFQGWMKTFEDNLVDLGGKLGAGTLVTSDAKSDAPLVEVKDLVGGYMIVSAGSLDEAIEIASACPGLVRPGSGVEVIEIHTP